MFERGHVSWKLVSVQKWVNVLTIRTFHKHEPEYRCLIPDPTPFLHRMVGVSHIGESSQRLRNHLAHFFGCHEAICCFAGDVAGPVPGVENVFDRHYQPTAGYNGRPRGVFVTAEWQPSLR